MPESAVTVSRAKHWDAGQGEKRYSCAMLQTASFSLADSGLPAPYVVVVLATWNGAANLQAQLDSYLVQSLQPSLLIVSDDGSDDATPEILRAFAASDPGFAVRLLRGAGQGAAGNFMRLLQEVPPEADLLALSDQDDVWLPDRLAQGARRLAALEAGQVGLQGGRSQICDAGLGPQGLTPVPRKALGFCHALVQNFAGGNTMLLNRAAIALVRAAAAEVEQVVIHDWWLYQIVSGCGGAVIFEETPLVLYRQHEGNQIGANTGALAKLRRLRMMIRGDFRRWNDINLRALRASEHRLTAANREILVGFSRLQQAGLIGRVRLLRQLGLYRQGLAGSLSLWLAVLLGRI